MKTLVIHPEDKTTDSLKAVYAGIDAEVVRDTRDSASLLKKIEDAERVICLGHGLPSGLIGTGMRLCIDHRHADLLREKRGNVYIWCYAGDFISRHRLSGFATGMFISEAMEASMLHVDFDGTELDDSNDLFASIVGESLVNGDSPEQIAENVLNRYVGSAPVIAYNRPLLGSYKDGNMTMNEDIFESQRPMFAAAEPSAYSLAAITV